MKKTAAFPEIRGRVFDRPRDRFHWCWLLIALILALPRAVPAQESADHLWRFAGQLYEEDDFYRAAGEYQRFIFLFPADERVPEAEVQIGRCYWHGGNPEEGFNRLLSLFHRRAAEPAGRRALREMIAIREGQQRYQEATYWARRYVELYPDDPEIDTVVLNLVWLQIDSGNYRGALATLEEITPQSSQYPEAHSLGQALQERPYRTKKSPKMAGILAAVLPGAGHLYVGRPGEAATSFLLNGVFIGAAAAAFAHDTPVLGGILVFFELGWYQGGIRSAAAAAREVNERDEKRYRRELRQKYRLSLGLMPAGDRMALTLRLEF